jgi:glycosyltransferase involved in cell wall biosynthesis
VSAAAWDLLIATIPHRHGKLCGLLAELDRQWRPGLGVLLCRDNLELPLGAKRQLLLAASRAGYVSFIDDDDMIYPGFVARVLAAMAGGPDFIGFTVEIVMDGVSQAVAEHSIRYPGWHSWPGKMVRDVSHLNPVRREIAVRVPFGGGYGEDHRWADGIRATGCLRTEEWVTGYAYRYQFSSGDNAKTSREPLAAAAVPPLPAYPWLRVLTTPESC